jgi:hypothetical protein
MVRKYRLPQNAHEVGTLGDPVIKLGLEIKIKMAAKMTRNIIKRLETDESRRPTIIFIILLTSKSSKRRSNLQANVKRATAVGYVTLFLPDER